jgi:hypothetical protein
VYSKSLFIYVAEYYSMVWLYHGLFNHSLVGGKLSYFQVLVFLNKAVTNVCAEDFAVFISLG